MPIDYQERIPNNVGLSSDRALTRSLEHWRREFLAWWRDRGPMGFQDAEVYLRTAVSVDHRGWASFGHVRMPEYRWGVFLADPQPDRKIGFGRHFGCPVWQTVPSEYRSALHRLIVTQADTEPASVEQQRLLGITAPSLYDLRNLFQVNVEEARHLWAMTYLLHAYFGREGQEQSIELLSRHAGSTEKPRILNTFNEPVSDWLSFFMYTFFADRDGKYQLMSLANSAFDPLARTCRFMLTEEAHHMFVGRTGIERIIRRTIQVMSETRSNEPDVVRAAGAIDLSTIQRYMNFWYSSSLDLFGSECSMNAAFYFSSGIKSRANEIQFSDHSATQDDLSIDLPASDGRIARQQVRMLDGLNQVNRGDFAKECGLFVDRWNTMIRGHGFDFEFCLPSPRFHRAIGAWAGARTDPAGRVLSPPEYLHRLDEWLPSETDKQFVQSLMRPVREPGRIAAWIAPPERGVNHQPENYEFVRLS